MPPLLDQYGNPIRKAQLPVELTEPTVTGIRSISVATQQMGSIEPRTIASILREAETGDPIRYLELAERMEETDLHYMAVLGTRRRQVSQLNVTVEPADDSPEAEKDAQLLRDWLRRDELEDELFDMLDSIGKGYSVSEIVWETSESQWMPQRLEYRLPAWFRYDQVTGSTLQRRDDSGRWIDLEPAKFVVHQHAAKSGLPIRGGLARIAAWAWMFKHFVLKDWVRFVEVYGMPLRVGKFHKGSTPEERSVLLRAVRNIASDAAAIMPEGMAIEFVTALPGAARADVYSGFLGYIDASVSKAVLGQTLTTQEGEKGTGSFALGKVHDEVRHDIERSDARQLAATLTRQVGVPLVILNHGMRERWPRFVIGREEKSDTAAMADALAKLVPLGLRVRSDEVRDHLGMSAPGENDEVLERAAFPALPGPLPRGDVPQETARAIARAIANVRQEDDELLRLADDAVALAAPASSMMIEAVRALVDRASSLEEVSAGLLGLAPDIDLDTYADAARSAFVLAELMGRSDLIDGR